MTLNRNPKAMTMNGRSPNPTESIDCEKSMIFDEWKAAGYVVIKGEKARWINGIAKFSRGQVKLINKKHGR